MSDPALLPDPRQIDQEILRFGRELFRRMRGEVPGVFNTRYWHGQALEWAMSDPSFKIDLFRFVDVLPSLTTADQVARHVHEYLLRDGRPLPRFIELALRAASSRWTAGFGAWGIRKNVGDMARHFIIGANPADALRELRRLRGEGFAFTADLLGEATLSDAEADLCQARYHELIDLLADETARWPPARALDNDHLGPIPRANISLKISALDPRLTSADPAGNVARLARRVLPLLLHARQRGVFVNFDMEQWELHETILALFERLATQAELRDWPHLGFVVQTYLKSAREDVERLAALAERRDAPLTVRLVKGAYWDHEIVRARQHGYPCPVHAEKSATDAAFEELTLLLLQQHEKLRSALGSHNLRSLTHGIVAAQRLGLPPSAYEIQMLYGMAEPERRALRALGHRVRLYTPIGELLPGMAYLVRRLLENTANNSFLRMGFYEGREPETLLERPAVEPAAEAPAKDVTKARPGFVNCPLTDFTDPAAREAFGRALDAARDAFPLRVPVAIASKTARGGRTLARPCPSEPGLIVAHVAAALPEDTDAAVDAAMRAWPAWRDSELETRARLLERLADLLEQDRYTLAAIQVFESAKPWPEADADVAEAVDYCRYYAAQARVELAPQRLDNVPGEENWLSYAGRGPTAVIAPWNFPLAILCGMSAAALVAGNPVLMKPAEQSSVMAHALHERMLRAGFPIEVAQFLPGLGEEVGQRLVEHPLVAQIAFTGSKGVGLGIIEQAARVRPRQVMVKHVVCEMGGKNAIVVDDDADLDEAVAGILKSAFDYAGQKCSAGSRLVAVGPVFAPLRERLVQACASLPALPAHDPACWLGPVIDEESWRRLREVIAHPGAGADAVFIGNAPKGDGWFVPPALFVVRDARHRLMQEEIFGPVLAIMQARSFEEALTIAMTSEYALTGAVFSRSPAHLELARRRFRVGNLYLNRQSTGALVGRQPFGGFHMSGLGTKAGGPGYLLQFVHPRTVTQNTTRHGFTPDLNG